MTREALFIVDGMTCSACVNTITSQTKALLGVNECSISLVTNECNVLYNGSQCNTDIIKETIEDCGFDCKLVYDTPSKDSAITKQGLLTVQGMTCGACVSSVTSQVENLPGVHKVAVALVTEECKVDFSPSEVSIEDIRAAIEDCGFDATIKSVTDTDQNQRNVKVIVLKIFKTSESLEGTEQLQSIVGHGVLTADLSNDDTLTIKYDRGILGIRDIIQRITALGYEAVVASSLDNDTQLKLLSKVKEIQYWKSTCLKACFFALTTMVMYMGIPMLIPKLMKNHVFPFNESLLKGLFYRDIIGLLAASYVQFGPGLYFYRASLKSLKHKSGTMDTLVCVSTSCAYFFSIYSILLNIINPEEDGMLPNVIFDTSVMLIAFISLGKLLETKAKAATSTALSKLISLTPSSCVILQNGDPKTPLEIPIDFLESGDIVEVKPGMRIPSDGVITQGETEVDESIMTGESLLVHKRLGSAVIGGSINGPGHIYFQATAVGDESKLSMIIQTMKQAQLTKAPIQRYADFLASIFVPSILCLALLTFILWSIILRLSSSPALDANSETSIFYRCFQRAISVVIVACPCALGLAAPTAIMVGTGVGAQNHVLIKGGDVLERFNNIGAFIFDKTGTLTTGRMKVKHFRQQGSSELTDGLVACIEASEMISEHPVAKAIVSYCEHYLTGKEHATAKVIDSKIYMGKGLSCNCELDGVQYNLVIGNRSLMPSTWQDSSSSSVDDSNGFTLSFVCVNGEVIGKFELTDDIKKDAYNTVQYLKRTGHKTYLVTGDTHGSALKVAQQVGLDFNNIFSEVSPSGKSDIVEQLKSEVGKNVVFVGDGINDSLALVTSDVGISISTGTDIAMEAADVVVLCDSRDQKASLRGLIDSMDISQKTFTRVKMNLFWALCYNTFMIPIAMGVLVPWGITLHPMAAGLAMAMSSVSVVMSSLALKRWRPVDIDSGEMQSHTRPAEHSWISRVFNTKRPPADQDIEMQVGLLQ